MPKGKGYGPKKAKTMKKAGMGGVKSAKSHYGKRSGGRKPK